MKNNLLRRRMLCGFGTGEAGPSLLALSNREC